MKLLNTIKYLPLVALTAFSFTLAGCGDDKRADDNTTIVKVGVCGDYNAHWDTVNKLLKDKHIQVQLVKFSDYATPNRALSDKEIDLNAFQHKAYLNNDIARNGYKLTPLCETFIAPIRLYNNKNKISNVADIKDGSIIAIPSDLTNGGRALKLLEAANLISVDPSKGFLPTKADITEYKVKIEIREAESGVLNNILPDIDAAAINGGNAFSAGLKPSDAIFSETPKAGEDNPYINVLVARAEDKDNEVYQTVVKTFLTDEVKETIIKAYDGGYIPVW
ncbi:MAG: MetQ/NlpA family ABC transporter substrate-binding protein [Aeromonadales bacterium]|nr:MetQ/NlpA family ABC transporter substrate-binding protein [Aeromonadales bacterium]